MKRLLSLNTQRYVANTHVRNFSLLSPDRRVHSARPYTFLTRVFTKSSNDGKRFNFEKWFGEYGEKQGKNKLPFPPPKEQKPDEPRQSIAYLLTAVIAGLYLLQLLTQRKSREISWQYFVKEMLRKGEVAKLEVLPSRDTVLVTLHPGAVVDGKKEPTHLYHFSISNADTLERSLQEIQDKMTIPNSDRVTVKYLSKPAFTISPHMLITAVILYFGWRLMRRRAKGGFKFDITDISEYIPMKLTILRPGERNLPWRVRFKDIAGLSEAKREVIEFVDYLQKPNKYRQLGARMPKGALLFGPPGTGKTMLAQAVASEANVTFIHMDGPAFIQLIGGLGASRVRKLFQIARQETPCIVYIDEIDAVGKARQDISSDGGNREEEQTLNQLLVELDGIEALQGVVVLTSTNRPDVLDPALLRPGRFDRQINIELPTLLERREIFAVHIKRIKTEKGKNTQLITNRMSQLCPDFSGADIANVCNEAALRASRMNKKLVEMEDFEYALDRVMSGMERLNNPLSLEEKKMLAFHEAGHALASWLLPHADELLKVSITPRTQAPMGSSQYIPSDYKLLSSEQLFHRMCLAIAGRAAEALVFNRISTGARDDLVEVSTIAKKKVQQYGMNERVGLVYLPGPGDEGGRRGKKFHSDSLQRVMDEESLKLVNRAYETVLNLLKENRDKLETIAKELLAHEILSNKQLSELIGPKVRPS